MTTETQNPPDENLNPADANTDAGADAMQATDPMAATGAMEQTGPADPKLALDDFSSAMGDGDNIAPPAGAGPAESQTNIDPAGLEALYDIPVNITVVLGRTHIEVTDLLALNRGDVVELDRKVGESIDILVNNRLVARGEVVLVEERLGITMTEIIKSKQAGV